MIEYLELDDVEDWSYNLYGYESQILKLRVYCESNQNYESPNLSIGARLLGLPGSIHIREIFDYSTNEES